MISPTLRAIFLMLLGLPILVAIALMAPELWIVSAGWIAGVGALIAVDTLLGASVRNYAARITVPPLLYVGSADDLLIELEFETRPPSDALGRTVGTGNFDFALINQRADLPAWQTGDLLQATDPLQGLHRHGVDFTLAWRRLADAAGRAELEAWLAEDRRHAGALLRAQAALSAIDHALAPEASNDMAVAPRSALGPGRRWVLAGAGGAA